MSRPIDMLTVPMEDAKTIRLAKAAVKAMNAVRNFPEGTSPWCRHVALMAESLTKRGRYPLLIDEPRYCANSLAITVWALWSARAEIVELRAELYRLRGAPVDASDAAVPHE